MSVQSPQTARDDTSGQVQFPVLHCNGLGATPLEGGIFLNSGQELIPLLDAVGNIEQQVSYAEHRNLLHKATFAKNYKFVQILLDKGVHIDRRGENGNTALLKAVVGNVSNGGLSPSFP